MPDEYDDLKGSLLERYYSFPKGEGSVAPVFCAGVQEIPTKEEVCVARVFHWLRNKKKGDNRNGIIKWCVGHSCYPSPKGHKVKRTGAWMPDPTESCLRHVDPFPHHQEEDGSFKTTGKPFAWWHHCRTFEHCLFLVKHRWDYLRDKIPMGVVCSVSAAMMMDRVPMLISAHDELTREFFADWCMGLVAEVPRGILYEEQVHG